MEISNFSAFKYSYKYNNLFSITISPPPRSLRDLDKLYLMDMLTICRFLNELSLHYCLYPEFTHSNGRLHYHGVLKIYNITKLPYITSVLTRRLGFTKIDPISTFKSHLTWLMYCQKEYASILSGDTFKLIKGPIIHDYVRNIRKKYEAKCNTLPKRKLIEEYFSK